MRMFYVIAMTLLFAAAASSEARADTWYPWCSHYTSGDVGGAISCGFVTREQCLATVSGIGGVCEQNVLPPPAATARSSRKRNSH